jgi:hypothetical protein
MKDDRTHLAYKAEHAVDLKTGAVLAVTLQEADQGDTTTVLETLAEAGENVAELIRTEAANQLPPTQPCPFKIDCHLVSSLSVQQPYSANS